MKISNVLALATALTFCSIASVEADGLKEQSWETISTDDGFITKRMSVEGSNIFAFRGETVADISIARILQVFLDSSTRKNWVAMYGGSVDLEVPNAMDRTYWIRFNTPFPTSDRDYVLRAIAKGDASKRVFTTGIESVKHASKGEQDCCVRGQAFGTFYRFEAIPGTKKTKVEVEVHTDPKGWIPAWVSNMVQKKWPKNTLMGLISEASKPATTEHPDYLNWHDKTVKKADTAVPKTDTSSVAPAEPTSAQ